MQMLALNARVHAAHIGEQGVTLGVLADSIHQLANETTGQVGIISLNLKEVVANSEKLTAKANQENLIFQAKAENIKENLEQIIAPIKKIDDEINLLLPRIDEAGKILADDIGQLTSGVTIHNRVRENIEIVVAHLSNISAKVRVNKTASSSPGRGNHLDDLARRYTMHTEREIHLQAAARVPAEIPLKIADTIANQSATALQSKERANDDNLGDNVELF
jgi:methyl-accepting chemotaxis protein